MHSAYFDLSRHFPGLSCDEPEEALNTDTAATIFGAIRFRDMGEQRWYSVNDHGAGLRHRGHTLELAKHASRHNRRKMHFPGTRGLEQHVVNEEGLYEILMRSTRHGAELFRRWLIQEIIPEYGGVFIGE